MGLMANLRVETIPPVVPIREFVLRLSEDEARVLIDILGRVGGKPDRTRRKYSEPIRDLLVSELGREPTTDLDGHLMFQENK